MIHAYWYKKTLITIKNGNYTLQFKLENNAGKYLKRRHEIYQIKQNKKLFIDERN